MLEKKFQLAIKVVVCVMLLPATNEVVGSIKPPVHGSQQRAGKGNPPREQNFEQFIVSLA